VITVRRFKMVPKFGSSVMVHNGKQMTRRIVSKPVHGTLILEQRRNRAGNKVDTDNLAFTKYGHENTGLSGIEDQVTRGAEAAGDK
jgi:hypothetical protein